MKYLAIALGVVISIPLLAYVAGLFIPESHTATVSNIYQAPSDSVWAKITDVKKLPKWRDNVKSVKVLSDSSEPLTWRETYTHNDPLTFEVTEMRDSTLLRVRIADKGLPFGGVWIYRLESQPGGTKLTITEQGEIYNPLFRFVSRFIMGYESTLREYHDHLKTALEPTEQ